MYVKTIKYVMCEYQYAALPLQFQTRTDSGLKYSEDLKKMTAINHGRYILSTDALSDCAGTHTNDELNIINKYLLLTYSH